MSAARWRALIVRCSVAGRRRMWMSGSPAAASRTSSRTIAPSGSSVAPLPASTSWTALPPAHGFRALCNAPLTIRPVLDPLRTIMLKRPCHHVLGRGHYERKGGRRGSNHRNGSYGRKFTLKGIGEVSVKVPRDRRGGICNTASSPGQTVRGRDCPGSQHDVSWRSQHSHPFDPLSSAHWPKALACRDLLGQHGAGRCRGEMEEPGPFL